MTTPLIGSVPGTFTMPAIDIAAGGSFHACVANDGSVLVVAPKQLNQGKQPVFSLMGADDYDAAVLVLGDKPVSLGAPVKRVVRALCVFADARVIIDFLAGGR